MVVAWSVVKYSLAWSRCLLLGKLTWIVTRFKLCFIICPKLVLDLKFQLTDIQREKVVVENAYCISSEKQCLHIVKETLMTPCILREILTVTLIYLSLFIKTLKVNMETTNTSQSPSSSCFTVRILSIGCDVLYPSFNFWGYFGKQRLIVHNHAAYCNNCKSERSEVQTDILNKSTF